MRDCLNDVYEDLFQKRHVRPPLNSSENSNQGVTVVLFTGHWRFRRYAIHILTMLTTLVAFLVAR